MSSVPSFDPPSAAQISADIERAFAEDFGEMPVQSFQTPSVKAPPHASPSGEMGAADATAALLPADAQAHAELTCRESAVIAGIPWFDACFRRMDSTVRIEWHAADGLHVAPGAVICRLSGRARALVSAERTALNFLQLLSATATQTAAYAKAVTGTKARLLDTRKTVPGLRVAQKYAVRCGGGHNQRMGLYDGILIKENHIIAAGGIAAVVAAGRRLHPALMLEVEVENLDELAQAIHAGADRIMLDNFPLALMIDAVALAAGRVPLEVSGNVDLETIRAFAETGIDFISVGALTKHVRAIDLSLRLRLD